MKHETDQKIKVRGRQKVTYLRLENCRFQIIKFLLIYKKKILLLTRIRTCNFLFAKSLLYLYTKPHFLIEDCPFNNYIFNTLSISMIRSGFTCRHIMVQSVYILHILTGQYIWICMLKKKKKKKTNKKQILVLKYIC